jgi:glutamate formiminotransferase/formiminotetrahydrofolate cyclodeaminase
MEVALRAMDLLLAMAKDGMDTSVSDAGVGALCIRGAVLGAGLNVRINAAQLTDEKLAAVFTQRAEELETHAQALESEILGVVRGRM